MFIPHAEHLPDSPIGIYRGALREEHRARMVPRRHWTDANIMGPVVVVEGAGVSGDGGPVLEDLRSFLKPHLRGGIRTVTNGQHLSFWRDGCDDFSPHIPWLWSLLLAYCEERRFGARVRWTPAHDLAAVHQVNAMEVTPVDAVKLMKLSHIVRLAVPSPPKTSSASDIRSAYKADGIHPGYFNEDLPRYKPCSLRNRIADLSGSIPCLWLRSTSTSCRLLGQILLHERRNEAILISSSTDTRTPL